MYDFDVSGMVAASLVQEVFNTAFVATGSEIDVEVLSQVQRTRTLFSRAVLDAQHSERFASRRRAALAQAAYTGWLESVAT